MSQNADKLKLIEAQIPLISQFFRGFYGCLRICKEHHNAPAGQRKVYTGFPPRFS